jgi:hypothetical protein
MEENETGEIGESSTQKRSNDTSAETPSSRKRFNKGGPRFDEVWEYFNQGEEVNPGHYKVSCHYCKKEWNRGKPAFLKAHLANECLPCPENISKYWSERLAESKTNYTRKSSTQNDIADVSIQPPLRQIKITQHFGSNKPLPPQVNDRIDQSLLKAWVIAGIPFEVIENPFIMDLFKDLNPGYIPPSRFTLSGQLLNKEVARVNNKINDELQVANGLTLSKYIMQFFFNINI